MANGIEPVAAEKATREAAPKLEITANAAAKS